ncbi:hypothetical protein [Embleya sp. NPDC005575]|uniref:hypothetical protein n=1 Tax=Embleya sp. NPDC005575 TaxID=3156892 RepID=UPI0033A24EAD
MASARVHSRYVRRLADSAVGHRGVVIELGVGGFAAGSPCVLGRPSSSRSTG